MHSSNDEYIERLRRSLQLSHKLEILTLIMKIGGLWFVAFMAFRSFRTFLKDPSLLPGFGLGMSYGFLCGLFIISGIWQLITVFVIPISAFQRLPRLLIEYHDLLRARQSLQSPKGSAAVASPVMDAAPHGE